MTSAPERRPRDSARTRDDLVTAASALFAERGYQGTRVRDIADQAGANISLINRYFGSKEGLFDACLQAALTPLPGIGDDTGDRSQLAAAIARSTVASDAHSWTVPILLLTQPSQERRTELARRRALRELSERIAARAVGTASAEPLDDTVLLQAQLILAMTTGLALLRSGTPISPLAKVREPELTEAIAAILDAAFGPRHPQAPMRVSRGGRSRRPS